MTKGPWEQPEAPPPARPTRPALPRHRLLLWLGLLAGLGVLAFALNRAFP
jgi:hypothetical protein